MSLPRLFADGPLAGRERVTLGADAARYVGRVLRARRGDSLTVFDGNGGAFRATVMRVTKSELELELGEFDAGDVESPLAVRLIQGVSRGDRMDTVVQKATELGVTRLTPLESEFSVVRLDEERTAKRLKHWRKVAASACEQCGRNRLPAIEAPKTLPAVAGEPQDPETTRLVFVPGAATPLDDLPASCASIEILIGPEGGLSPGEQALAVEAGFTPTTLGPRILRTETAAIAALALAQARWGDLRRPAPDVAGRI